MTLESEQTKEAANVECDVQLDPKMSEKSDGKAPPRVSKGQADAMLKNSFAMRSWFDYSRFPKYSHGNISSYDPSWLVSFGWLLPTWASILHEKFLIAKAVVILFLTTALAVVKCPEDDNPRTFAGTVRCVSLPSDWSSLTLLTIASFMMALFTRTVLDRWWQTRKHVASVGGRAKNITMFLCSWTATAAAPVAEQRARAVRLLNLAHALLLYAGNPDRESATRRIQPLLDAGVCTPEEFAAVANMTDPFVIVLGWVACILADLSRTHGALTDGQLQELNDLLADMRNNAGDALLFVGTQLPYAAIQLITMIVYAFEVQLLAVCGGIIGAGLAAGRQDKIFVGYVTIVLASGIYLGLLELYTALTNPFGGDVWDFPSVAYQDGLLKATAALEDGVVGAAAGGMLGVARDDGRAGGRGGPAAGGAEPATLVRRRDSRAPHSSGGWVSVQGL